MIVYMKRQPTILIGTLIWYTQHIKKAEQNKRKLKQNGVLAQAKIIETWHPKKDKEVGDVLDEEMTSVNDKETELIIKYEHKAIFNPFNLSMIIKIRL